MVSAQSDGGGKKKMLSGMKTLSFTYSRPPKLWFATPHLYLGTTYIKAAGDRRRQTEEQK